MRRRCTTLSAHFQERSTLLTFGDAQGLVAPIARHDTDQLRRDHHASIGKMVEQPRSAAALEITLIRALA